MSEIKLYEKKKNCCGCSACLNICPKQAISMCEDEYGFTYPKINEEQCIQCGMCKKVCAYQNNSEFHKPISVFAAFNKNKEQLLNSASGGIFSAVATEILQKGGVVFGASLDFDNGHGVVRHLMVEKAQDLYKLQGSKYVQSSIGDCYKQAKTLLLSGRKVLFSGTPCQIAGLYGYLGADYENLTTIDLICHGVPSNKFFDDYLQTEKINLKANQITAYAFRDKSKGWGMNSRISATYKNNKKRSLYIHARMSSYFSLFLDSCTYRENCYFCKYAKAERVGDLTIGDYWGIEKEHPELLQNGGYVEKNGISCILANTQKGIDICNELEDYVRMDKSELEKILRNNGQLSSPSKKSPERDIVLKLYKNDGYVAVDKYFTKKYKKQILMHRIYNAIPRPLRLKIKKLLKG